MCNVTAVIKKLIFKFCLASGVLRLNPNHHIWLVSYENREQNTELWNPQGSKNIGSENTNRVFMMQHEKVLSFKNAS